MEEKICELLIPYKTLLIDENNKLTILGCLAFVQVGIIIYNIMEEIKYEKK